MKTKKLLITCTFLFSLFFIHQSCTKIDARESFSHNTTDDVTQKFFRLPANANPAILRVAAEMKKRNDAKEFVTAFVKNNGYPVWDKAIIKKEKPAVANRGNNSFDDEADTLVVLPVAAADAAYVTGFVNARLNGDVSLNLYRGGDYAMYGFNDVPEDSINADKAAFQIMLLNRQVFGYTEFKVIDKRLFHSSAGYSDTTRLIRTVKLDDDNGSNLYIQCLQITISTSSNHCPYPIGGCSGDGGNCDNCAGVCATVTYETTNFCSPWDTNDQGGGGPTGGGPHNGGPGGGATPNPDFPCASSQGKGIAAANPCGGPVVVPPVIPLPQITLPFFDPVNYPETPVILAFEDDYRTHMSPEEIVIFDNMSRFRQLKYLYNAQSAIDWSETFYPLTELHNGNGDAFRHALFSALNAASFGAVLAKQLGDAHELAQPIEPLEVSMDLFNNQYGRDLSQIVQYGGQSPDMYIQTIINILRVRIANGELKKLSPLDINSKVIPGITQLVPTN